VNALDLGQVLASQQTAVFFWQLAKPLQLWIPNIKFSLLSITV